VIDVLAFQNFDRLLVLKLANADTADLLLLAVIFSMIHCALDILDLVFGETLNPRRSSCSSNKENLQTLLEILPNPV
jgi:hypothetical protein